MSVNTETTNMSNAEYISYLETSGKITNLKPTNIDVTDGIYVSQDNEKSQLVDELLGISEQQTVSTQAVSTEAKIEQSFLSEIKSKTLLAAQQAEDQACDVFHRIKTCPDNFTEMETLVNSLSMNDLLCMRTTLIKFPKTLFHYVMGNEKINPELGTLIYNKLRDVSKEVVEKDCCDQLLHNAVRGHKEAMNVVIRKLKSINKFDINYTDETGMNAIKLAILHCHSSGFLKFLLDQDFAAHSLQDYDDNDNETWEQTVCHMALNSDLLTACNDQYIDQLNILVDYYKKYGVNLPKNFVKEYFNKKANISNKTSEYYHDLETKLAYYGIDDYFDNCERPLEIVKLCYNNLKESLKK